MATILQFAERLADGQDWTASERAQLRDVGAQLDGVDVVFGQSEAGDPWCVVTDDGGEVLLHVARIGGDFVVHATRDDEVVQDDDLWSAAKRLLGDMLKERRGVLLAFPPEALGQTAVLAFLFAAAMRGEFDHWLPGGSAAPPPLADPHGAVAEPSEAGTPPQATATATHHAPDPAAPVRGEVTRETAGPDAPDAQAPAAAQEAAPRGGDGDAPAADAAPAPQPPQRPPVPSARPGPGEPRDGGGQTEFAAFNGGDRSGGAQGGAGGGAAGGTVQTTAEPAPHAPLSEAVQGGDGDDRIVMAAHVKATGGAGADTFVLTLPAAGGGAPVLLGAVGDFRPAEGDRLEVVGKGVVVVDRAEADLLSALRTGAAEVPVIAGRHIGYDVDGDGKEDAYVLVTSDGGDWFAAGARPAGGAPAGGMGPQHGGSGVAAPASEAVHAPIGLTGEAPHPPAGAEFTF